MCKEGLRNTQILKNIVKNNVWSSIKKKLYCRDSEEFHMNEPGFVFLSTRIKATGSGESVLLSTLQSFIKHVSQLTEIHIGFGVNSSD